MLASCAIALKLRVESADIYVAADIHVVHEETPLRCIKEQLCGVTDASSGLAQQVSLV